MRSLRDCNAAFHRLAEQRGKGRLSIEEYQAARGALLDEIRLPHIWSRLVDDAPTLCASHQPGPISVAGRKPSGPPGIRALMALSSVVTLTGALAIGVALARVFPR